MPPFLIAGWADSQIIISGSVIPLTFYAYSLAANTADNILCVPPLVVYPRVLWSPCYKSDINNIISLCICVIDGNELGCNGFDNTYFSLTLLIKFIKFVYIYIFPVSLPSLIFS